MALPPCHVLWNVVILGDKLNLAWYPRSCDLILGVPFNIASYALLTMMMARVTGLQYGELIHTFGDAHLYLNHLEQVNEQLSRKPYPLPEMQINEEVDSIFNYKFEDFNLINYQAHPHISAPVAV